MIPTFAASGQRLRDRTLRNVEHLLALSLVVVRRNKRGKILSATFRPLSGANPLRRSAQGGTKFYFRERVGEQRLIYQHKASVLAQGPLPLAA